jgi:hypothetical protein
MSFPGGGGDDDDNDDSLEAEDQIEGKPCLVTTDTAASIIISKTNITTRLFQRVLTWLYGLQIASSPCTEGSSGRDDFGGHPLRT